MAHRLWFSAKHGDNHDRRRQGINERPQAARIGRGRDRRARQGSGTACLGEIPGRSGKNSVICFVEKLMSDSSLVLSIAVLGGTGKEGKGLAYRWARAG